MKIYADAGPASTWRSSADSSSALSLVDPLLIAFAYVFVALGFHRPLGTHDALLLILTLALTYPGKLSFQKNDRWLGYSILAEWALVVAVLMLFGWTTKYVRYFDQQVLALWVGAVPLTLLGVHAAAPRLAPYTRILQDRKDIVIVGTGIVARRLAAAIQAEGVEGQRTLGFFDDRSVERLGDVRGMPILGKISDVAPLVRKLNVAVIYIALPMASQPRILALLDDLKDTTATIHFVPDIFVSDLIQARVKIIAGMPVVAVCDTPFHGWSAFLKRTLDLTLTLAVMPLVLPLLLGIALLVRATSPGPAIFKQRRYGLGGEEIMVWKFRTMKVMEDGEKTYKQVTRDDDRVTRIGRVLRKTSLDELPQLINVLLGDMSLIGPRPHAVAVNEQYRKLISGYMVRHKVKPGITGWAQVNGYRGGDDLPSMRKRIEFDLEYLRQWSLALDVMILIKTIAMLVKGDSKAF